MALLIPHPSLSFSFVTRITYLKDCLILAFMTACSNAVETSERLNLKIQQNIFAIECFISSFIYNSFNFHANFPAVHFFVHIF